MAAVGGGPLNQNANSRRTANLFYSGSCRPKPGLTSIGFVLYDGIDGHIIEEFSACLGSFTVPSDAAHYRALIAGLQHASSRRITDIIANGHSIIVSDQVNVYCRAKHPLRVYRDKVVELRQKFENFYVRNIGRKENAIACNLARRGFRYTIVDRSIRTEQEILYFCRHEWATRKYILEQRWDGCQRIHYIIDIIRRYLPGSYRAVQVLARQLRERELFPRYLPAGPVVQNLCKDLNNVECLPCLIAMQVDIN